MSSRRPDSRTRPAECGTGNQGEARLSDRFITWRMRRIERRAFATGELDAAGLPRWRVSLAGFWPSE